MPNHSGTGDKRIGLDHRKIVTRATVTTTASETRVQPATQRFSSLFAVKGELQGFPFLEWG